MGKKICMCAWMRTTWFSHCHFYHSPAICARGTSGHFPIYSSWPLDNIVKSHCTLSESFPRLLGLHLLVLLLPHWLLLLSLIPWPYLHQSLHQASKHLKPRALSLAFFSPLRGLSHFQVFKFYLYNDGFYLQARPLPKLRTHMSNCPSDPSS